MKNDFILFALLFTILQSCTTVSYLPHYSEIGTHPRGSYIKVTNVDLAIIQGELIAIDENRMVVFNDELKKCVSIPNETVKKFNLRYAKPKNYGWSLLVFPLLSLSHGFYAIVTMPINLIVAISVTAAGHSAYTYTQKNLTYKNLRMFEGKYLCFNSPFAGFPVAQLHCAL